MCVPDSKLHPSLLHRLRIELHAAWLAARDNRTPWYAVVIPLGLWLFAKMLPTGLLDQYRAVAERESERPNSMWGVAIVILLWLLAAALIYLLLAFSFN